MRHRDKVSDKLSEALRRRGLLIANTASKMHQSPNKKAARICLKVMEQEGTLCALTPEERQQLRVRNGP